MKIVADNGEGCTVEEGTAAIDISPQEAVLVLREDLTHRLIIPSISDTADVSRHTLALTAIAVLIRDNPEWVDSLCAEVFGEMDDDDDDGRGGPVTKGSA